jgi:UPF0176 protein
MLSSANGPALIGAPVLNISAYLFVELNGLPELRERIEAQAGALELKGTVLIAPEGINLFLAGAPHQVRAMVSFLRQGPRLAGLAPKDSYSGSVPFGKLKVKIKREIIRMNHPTIRPQDGRAPSVSAATVRRWLDTGQDDAGRPVVMLDTRNGFEVDHGSFRQPIDWRLNKFSDFPQALLDHRDDLMDKTVVSFCTGGIRCEKAALFMREQGLPHVYQLEGGILKYLEETDAHHWQGECFVFDERVGLNEGLQPSAEAQQGPAGGPGPMSKP